jgi:hypothetical protein
VAVFVVIPLAALAGFIWFIMWSIKVLFL